MNAKLLTLISIIFALALFRILPHPPNVSPVAAMALFGGAYLADKRLAFIVPFVALLLSDLVIGLHDTMVFVYLGLALTVLTGFALRHTRSFSRIVAATLVSTLVFFVLTNFGAWLSHALYPKTAQGLMQAYAAGIPFLQNSLLGNFFFTALLFGGYAALKRSIAVLGDAESRLRR